MRHYYAGGDGKLQGDVIYAAGENSTNDDVTAWVFGVEAEHMLRQSSNSFLTGFVRYENYHVDEDLSGGGSDDSSAQVIKFGIRASFGHANPQDRDHNGAGVDIADWSRLNSVARGVD